MLKNPHIIIISILLSVFTSISCHPQNEYIRQTRRAKQLSEQTVFVEVAQTLAAKTCQQTWSDNTYCTDIMKKLKPVSITVFGSGVFVKYKNETHVLTVSHVCSPHYNKKITKFGITVSVHEELKISISAQNFKSTAKIVKNNIQDDLCLLKISNRRKQHPAYVASYEPGIGEKVHYSGAPLGYMSDTSLLMFDGKYAGSHQQKSLFSLPCAPGASGSGIRNEMGKIVSILQRVDARFSRVCIGATLKEVSKFLKSN